MFRSAAFTVALACFVTGCGAEREAETPDNQVNTVVSPLPKLPVAEPPMDRAALLLAVAKSASAAALGQNDAEDQRKLDGKRFEVRIRFGCAGGSRSKSDAGPFNIRFDSEDRTLRVRAAPDLTLSDPAVAALAGPTAEAVEGFWMHRPWLLADGCTLSSGTDVPTNRQDDAAPEAATPVPPRGPRVGLAQFFSATDPRTGRRDQRAYEATKILGTDQQPSSDGYNLVLSGRLRQLSTGRVIACRTVGPDAAPECIASAEFDRVWIEHPDTRAILAEWTS